MKTPVMAGLALALWAPSVAGAAEADKRNGRAAGIPEALARIEAQTTRIEQQVGDPASGLAALRAGVEGVGTAVQQVGADVTASVEGRAEQILSAVDATTTAVNEVRAGIERLTGPANTVWVSPYWAEGETGEGGGFPTPAHIFYPARIVVLNTGITTAHVGCSFFSATGTLLLDRGKSLILGPGATGTCHSFPDPVPPDVERGEGWLVVHGDRPVIVYGWYQSEQQNDDRLQREEMRFFPVDCSSPAAIESVCAVVPPAP